MFGIRQRRNADRRRPSHEVSAVHLACCPRQSEFTVCQEDRSPLVGLVLAIRSRAFRSVQNRLDRHFERVGQPLEFGERGIDPSVLQVDDPTTGHGAHVRETLLGDPAILPQFPNAPADAGRSCRRLRLYHARWEYRPSSRIECARSCTCDGLVSFLVDNSPMVAPWRHADGASHEPLRIPTRIRNGENTWGTLAVRRIRWSELARRSMSGRVRTKRRGPSCPCGTLTRWPSSSRSRRLSA